jgi:hypothetical protein
MSFLRANAFRRLCRFLGMSRGFEFSFGCFNCTRYPDGLAWQFNVPKKVLRKSEEFKKFHSFLVFETEVVCVLSCDGLSVTLIERLQGKHIQTRGSQHASSPLFRCLAPS